MISYSLLNLECAALVQDEMFLFSSNSLMLLFMHLFDFYTLFSDTEKLANSIKTRNLNVDMGQLVKSRYFLS